MGVNTPPHRAVNFQKGIARMIFSDQSGSVAVQNFTLADGEICVRAQYIWAPSQSTASYSIYPSGDNYDWEVAADKIADGWVSGMVAATAQAESARRRVTETKSGLERLAVAS